jgi:hypothetical protein
MPLANHSKTTPAHVTVFSRLDIKAGMTIGI